MFTPPEIAERVQTEAEVFFNEDLAASVSRLPNSAGLVYKVLGRESSPVKSQIRRFWATARRWAVDRAIMEPFLWK